MKKRVMMKKEIEKGGGGEDKSYVNASTGRKKKGEILIRVNFDA